MRPSTYTPTSKVTPKPISKPTSKPTNNPTSNQGDNLSENHMFHIAIRWQLYLAYSIVVRKDNPTHKPSTTLTNRPTYGPIRKPTNLPTVNESKSICRKHSMHWFPTANLELFIFSLHHLWERCPHTRAIQQANEIPHRLTITQPYPKAHQFTNGWANHISK